MKTTFLMSAALLGTLSLAGAVQAQDMPRQQDAQPVSASSASPGTSTSATPGTTAYGGVSGSASASGSLTGAGWTNCGHRPQCSPDSGH